MAGPDLQKEVRAIKRRTNPGSSRNFAAVTVQHTKAPLPRPHNGAKDRTLVALFAAPMLPEWKEVLHQPPAVEEL